MTASKLSDKYASLDADQSFVFDRGLHRPNTSRQILPVMFIGQKADVQSQHIYYLQSS